MMADAPAGDRLSMERGGIPYRLLEKYINIKSLSEINVSKGSDEKAHTLSAPFSSRPTLHFISGDFYPK